MGGFTLRNLGLAVAATLIPASALAQQTPPPPPDQQDKDQTGDPSFADVVVTGMKVRQGGAQDIGHFRAIADDVGMPRPESLTAEGLMGEYDLTLPGKTACAQLFCVVAEAMPAALPGRASDKQFVGLGFTSNIDEHRWHRAPLDLIAVVDKSGSMDGTPLARVRASLRQVVGQMRDGDRLGIVLYGDTAAVYLPPTDIAEHRDAVLAAIDGIRSAGSTDMESGLRVGYDTAFAEAPRFKGNTRLMLFTDEQPNVGRTDARSFIGMAEEASRRGIGLTTIGVGVQFDASLASKVSSARGGNLFFLGSDGDVKTVFEKQLDTMVSELAHDLHLTLTPATGWKISGVFGVPDGTMTEAPGGAVMLTVPTVFLSTNGGGIFATLAKAEDRADLPAATVNAGDPLVSVALDYRPATGGPVASDNLVARADQAAPSMALRQAQLLVDEYLTLRSATTVFHQRNDAKAAYALLSGLSGRLQSSGLSGMGKENKLVGQMLTQAAFYAGYAGETPKTLRHLAVVGKWEIVGADGFTDLHRGDRLEFTGEREMLTYRKTAGLNDADESESYEINERDIHLVGSRLVMHYTAKGDRMTMQVDDGDGHAALALRRLD
ncbi:MAG TPA: VWA domain-containing protein [Sphingomonas sp.]|nr:VWA domain-containing protein [Sphingomonas sp.]